MPKQWSIPREKENICKLTILFLTITVVILLEIKTLRPYMLQNFGKWKSFESTSVIEFRLVGNIFPFAKKNRGKLLNCTKRSGICLCK